jgi:hypothetical protein
MAKNYKTPSNPDSMRIFLHMDSYTPEKENWINLVSDA